MHAYIHRNTHANIDQKFLRHDHFHDLHLAEVISGQPENKRLEDPGFKGVLATPLISLDVGALDLLERVEEREGDSLC